MTAIGTGESTLLMTDQNLRLRPAESLPAAKIAPGADVAQLVERRLPKPKVAGSRPVVRFQRFASARLKPLQTSGFLLQTLFRECRARTAFHGLAGGSWLHFGYIDGCGGAVGPSQLRWTPTADLLSRGSQVRVLPRALGESRRPCEIAC